jgi:hypothetical protein
MWVNDASMVMTGYARMDQSGRQPFLSTLSAAAGLPESQWVDTVAAM